MTQEWPDGRDAQGTVWGNGEELPHPQGAPLSPNTHLLTHQEALRTPSTWGFYGGFITQA